MSRDFYAEYPATDLTQLQRLAQAPPGGHAPTFAALLAQSSALEEASLAGVEMYSSAVRSSAYQRALTDANVLLDQLAIGAPAFPDWSTLPDLSVYLRIDFRLATAFLARDDRAFSVTENPVRRDRVFGLPFVSSTSWKGGLRHACRMKDKRACDRIFGPNRGADADFQAFRGRLYTYPSFFTKIGFEMINPHDRVSRTGKNPIRMECVPAGGESRFAVLYVPLSDHPGSHRSDGGLCAEVAEDMCAVARACSNLLSKFGFSAKKSSGYGSAHDELVGEKGVLSIKSKGVSEQRFSRIGDLEGLAAGVAAQLRQSE